MNSVYIYHHLGLGDCIICNGIVRYYSNKFETVYVFTKPRNVSNCIRMYKDNPKIKIIAMEDYEIRNFMKNFPQNNYLIIGHEKLHIQIETRNTPFDKIFFEMAGLNIEDKWEKFYIQRDLEKEKEVFYNILGLKDSSKFLFFHDDIGKEYFFNPQYFSQGIKIIRPNEYKDIGIFDFLYTLEKASEIHVMNSSFLNLIDCIQLSNPYLFYHKYVRNDAIEVTLKLKWKIYE